MAQSVERRLGKAEVTGPIPVISFFYFKPKPLIKAFGFFIFTVEPDQFAEGIDADTKYEDLINIYGGNL